MKIEICEQMVQSWLQHIEKCQVVQTNWMISPLRNVTDVEIIHIDAYMKDIAQELNSMVDEELKAAIALRNEIEFSENASMASLESECEESDISELAMCQNMMDCFAVLNKKERNAIQNIFGKSTPEQFVRQCEIDVVGIKLPQDNYLRDFCQVEKIYLVDSAFHKGTLGYKDAAARVLKKIIRAIIVAELVFGTRVPIEIAFATPNCTPGLNTKINDLKSLLEKTLTKLYGNKYEKMEIKLYFNDVFATKIYHPLREEIDKLNNDNDLFMRSMNLAKVAEEKIAGTKKKVTSTPATGAGKKTASSTASVTPKKSATRRPWGPNQKRVFDILQGVIKSGKMTPAVLNYLQIAAYANKYFKLSTFPVLQKETAFPSTGWDRSRFYSDALEIAGESYLVCAQMRTSSIDKMEAWAKTL